MDKGSFKLSDPTLDDFEAVNGKKRKLDDGSFARFIDVPMNDGL
jgi:hypothetical protein